MPRVAPVPYAEMKTEVQDIVRASDDAMAGDHKNQDFDAIFVELRRHYTEPQIVELGWRTSVFIGYGRLVFALGVDAVGPSCRLPH